MRPNLIVIGAAKAGTTSLHYYLGLHPDISMSGTKELRFFSHDRVWSRGLEWYEAQFTGRALIHGEASPSYAMYPHYPDAAARIRAAVPEAKLIYLVRDPIARIVSHWVYATSYGGETRPFAECLRDPDNRYLAASQYYRQIERYTSWCAAGQLLVVSHHDLAHDLRPTLQQIFRFLGVDDGFWSPEFTRRLNETRPRRRNRVGRWLHRLNGLPVVTRLPVQWRTLIGRYAYMPFSSPISAPVLDADVLSDLVPRLEPDVRRLREWTGRSFEDWTL